MDSKIIMSLEELSQILAAIGISSSQEEHILTIVKNLSTYPKDIEEPYSYEQCLQEDKETSIDHFCESTKENEDSWIVFTRDKPLVPEIKKAKENNTWSDVNEEMDQGHHDYIEKWFQTIIASKNHYLL